MIITPRMSSIENHGRLYHWYSATGVMASACQPLRIGLATTTIRAYNAHATAIRRRLYHWYNSPRRMHTRPQSGSRAMPFVH